MLPIQRRVRQHLFLLSMERQRVPSGAPYYPPSRALGFAQAELGKTDLDIRCRHLRRLDEQAPGEHNVGEHWVAPSPS